MATMETLVRLSLVAFTLKLSSAYFTKTEHEAFKSLDKNPMMEYYDDVVPFADDLKYVMKKLKYCRKFPGGSVAVVKPGMEVFTEGYGTFDAGNRNRRITGNTNFQIQGVTHSFTAVLLVIVLSEYNENNPGSVITFDTKIKDILGPGYNLSNDYISEMVTLRDLLSSRVGFQLRREVTELSIFSPANVSREEMSKALKYMDDMKPFRDGYNHNHYNWMLLGHIAEKITGRSWEWLIKNKILKPAGMDRARIWKSKDDLNKRDTARSLWVSIESNMEMKETTDEYNDGRYPFEPSVGIIANADDMAKWMYILLTNGRAPNGITIFDSSLYFDTFEPSNFLPVDSPRMVRPLYPMNSVTYSVALPWNIGSYKGFEVHSVVSAGLFGTSAALVLLRDVNIGIFVATRGPGVSWLDLYELVIDPVLYFLMDGVLGLRKFYTASNICTYPFYIDPRDNYRRTRSSKQEVTVEGLSKLIKSADSQKQDVLNAVGSYALVAPSDNITGIYSHPLYGSYNVFTNSTYILWTQSENSYGEISLVNSTASDELKFELYWFAPLEFAVTYYLNNSRFFDPDMYGQFQKLQIEKDGPVYERGIMVP